MDNYDRQVTVPCKTCGKHVDILIELDDPIPGPNDTPYIWCEPCEQEVYTREYALFDSVHK